ncbi:MAG: FAD-dependent oxidoreductase [Pseudomonadota bacterium]
MSRSRVILLVLIAAAIAIFFALDLDRFLTLDALKAARESLAGWVAANFATAIAAFFVAYVAVTALSLPGAAIMTLAGGALFGLVAGTIAVSFASTLGATLAFIASRFLFRDAVRAKFGQRLAAFEEGVRRDGAFYLFTLRLVPAFPFFLVNLLMGLTPIRTLTYAGVSQLGMLPGTIVFVYAGTQLAQLDSLAGILSPGLVGAFVAIGVLPLLMRWIANLIAARRVYRGHRKPPRFDYNLVVIGAGSAGLVSGYIGAAVKAKVALIERHKMGGDCLNTGCVPSKALIRSARLLADARDSGKLGIRKVEATFDFAEVMERVQQVVAAVEPHDSIERYTGLGVDCIVGEARIVSPWAVEVAGRRISARSIIIATGARPLVPKLPGLDGVQFLTSDTLWGLREQPRRLLVLGGGPIGCELSLAFARLGSSVTQVEMAPRLLPREDEDVSALLARVFAHEGVDARTGHRAIRVEPASDGLAGILVAEGPAGEVRIAFDRILLALGRTANVGGFGLEELGVRIGARGTIEADPLMRTNFPNIAVCGDVTGPYQFTHVSAHQAWYASVNQLLAPFWSFRVDYRVIPWATFTDPQVARVGLSEAEAKAQGIAYEVTRYGIDDLDRAIADGTAEGFVKVLTEPGKDRILGATIVHAEAGELIAEYVLAMKHGLGMNKILGTIHAYPTLMEANKYVAGNWKRANAPQGALRFAQRFFAWRRG